jgi:hypothetical protein
VDQQKLDRLAREFVRALQTDTVLQEHVSHRKGLSVWAQEHLMLERIPNLLKQELLDFFRNLDHFVLVGSTKVNFDGMIRAIGIDGLRNALLNLVVCGEQGL